MKLNSSMNEDDLNPKGYIGNVNKNLISEHESDQQSSQSNLKKDIEEEKRLQISDESSSESVSINRDIHGEGDEINSDIDSDQDSNRIQKLRDASNFNEKETKNFIKSSYETDLY